MNPTEAGLMARKIIHSAIWTPRGNRVREYILAHARGVCGYIEGAVPAWCPGLACVCVSVSDRHPPDQHSRRNSPPLCRPSPPSRPPTRLPLSAAWLKDVRRFHSDPSFKKASSLRVWREHFQYHDACCREMEHLEAFLRDNQDWGLQIVMEYLPGGQHVVCTEVPLASRSRGDILRLTQELLQFSCGEVAAAATGRPRDAARFCKARQPTDFTLVYTFLKGHVLVVNAHRWLLVATPPDQDDADQAPPRCFPASRADLLQEISSQPWEDMAAGDEQLASHRQARVRKRLAELTEARDLARSFVQEAGVPPLQQAVALSPQAVAAAAQQPFASWFDEWCRFESPRCPGTEKRRHHCDCGSEDCGGGGSLCDISGKRKSSCRCNTDGCGDSLCKKTLKPKTTCRCCLGV